jgi:hypothetical protein
MNHKAEYAVTEVCPVTHFGPSTPINDVETLAPIFYET